MTEMENKLGLSSIDASDISDKIVEFKASLLNDKMTFGCDDYDLEYLCKLHEFLFGDVYPDANMISDRYKGNDLTPINNKIQYLFSVIAGKEDRETVKTALIDLIDMQIFDDGNNRTIVLFAKQIIDTWSITDKKYYEDLGEFLTNGGKRL
jgi:fido (protein-threonine AMPylation protein)